MADSAVGVTDATTGVAVPVDSRTTAGGEHRQVLVLGDADAAQTAKVDAGGNVAVRAAQAATPTNTTPAIAAINTGVVLLAANPNRLAATVYNALTGYLYLRLGAASNTEYTLRMPPGSYYEAPAGYTGALAGFGDVVGSVRVCEVVS